MKLHELKIENIYFFHILSERKTFELRKNDRDFQVGDLIHFVNTHGIEFERKKDNLYKITYILKDVSEYGLNKDYCILSIEKVRI